MKKTSPSDPDFESRVRSSFVQQGIMKTLDAQAALTQAEFRRIEALHAHANARSGLRYVMGQDPLADGTGQESGNRGTP